MEAPLSRGRDLGLRLRPHDHRPHHIARRGAPAAPVRGAAILEYVAAHCGVYLAELICFVGLSVPAIVVFFSLGVALFPYGRSLAALGALIGLSSEIVALALGSSPPSLTGGLVVLSDRYAVACEAARSSLATAAEALAAYANAISPAGILTALGILLLSILIAKGPFPKWLAIMGIATEALGILFEALGDLVGAAYGLYGILLPLWFLLVGLRLLYLSGRSSE